MTKDEIQRKLDELGPWFYNFELPGGITVRTSTPDDITPIFHTRLKMIRSAVMAYFGERIGEVSALDAGCHEGFYSLALARLGVKTVMGIDARDSNLVRARFMAEASGIVNVNYRMARVEDLAVQFPSGFDLTLFLGVLYHSENQMLCLRNLAAATRHLCLIETQVMEEVDGVTEWGSSRYSREYRGVIALIDEAGEFDVGNREAGVTSIGGCPSPKALRFMLTQAGFSRVDFLTPPVDAYEQHARGKRVMCAAWKTTGAP
jgi:tRNA (mo5U34)-methyltransferase